MKPSMTIVCMSLALLGACKTASRVASETREVQNAPQTEPALGYSTRPFLNGQATCRFSGDAVGLFSALNPQSPAKSDPFRLGSLTVAPSTTADLAWPLTYQLQSGSQILKTGAARIVGGNLSLITLEFDFNASGEEGLPQMRSEILSLEAAGKTASFSLIACGTHDKSSVQLPIGEDMSYKKLYLPQGSTDTKAGRLCFDMCEGYTSGRQDHLDLSPGGLSCAVGGVVSGAQVAAELGISPEDLLRESETFEALEQKVEAIVRLLDKSPEARAYCH